MSGGAYDYLGAICADDLADLLAKESALREMADRLAGLGYAADAAAETEELLVMLRQWRVRAEVRARRLLAVWRAVEWWDSADWTEDHVREALRTYRGGEGEAGHDRHPANRPPRKGGQLDRQPSP